MSVNTTEGLLVLHDNAKKKPSTKVKQEADVALKANPHAIGGSAGSTAVNFSPNSSVARTATETTTTESATITNGRATTTDNKMNLEDNIKLSPIKIFLDLPDINIFYNIGIIIKDNSTKVALDKLSQLLNSLKDEPEEIMILIQLSILLESARLEKINILKEFFSLNPKLDKYINCFLFLPWSKAENDHDRNSVLHPATHQHTLTLLGFAAYHCHFTIIKFLVEEKDADVSAFSRFGITPLHEVFLGNGLEYRNSQPTNDNLMHLEERLLIAQYLLKKGASLQVLSTKLENNLYSAQAPKVVDDQLLPREYAFWIPREKILYEIENSHHRIKTFTFKQINNTFMDLYNFNFPCPELIFEYLHGDIKITPENIPPTKNAASKSLPSNNTEIISGKFYSLVSRATQEINSTSLIGKILGSVAFILISLVLRNHLLCGRSRTRFGAVLPERKMCFDAADGPRKYSPLIFAFPVVTLLFSSGMVKYNTYKENERLRKRLDNYNKKK